MEEDKSPWGPPDPADLAVDDDESGFAWWWFLVLGVIVAGLLIWALSGGDGDTSTKGGPNGTSVSVGSTPLPSEATGSAAPDDSGPTATAAPVPESEATPDTAGEATNPLPTQPPAQVPGVSTPETDDGDDGGAALVKGAKASSNCVAKSSTDSRGNKVGFAVSNLLDGDRATAWRCPGSAVDTSLEIKLGKPRRIRTLGAVPGWDHVDRYNKDDRFKENRRLVSARWECLGADDKVVAKVRQDFTGRREMQKVKAVGFKNCAAIRLVVLDTTRAGRRDFLAMSDVHIS